MDYQEYYRGQIGGGGITSIYVGSRNQRGHGFVSNFGRYMSGLVRKVFPLLKSGAKAVGGQALRAGVDILTDVATQNIHPREAIRTRFRESSAALKRKADEKIDSMLMSGQGYKLRRSGISPHLLNTLGLVNSVAGVSGSKKKRKRRSNVGRKKGVRRKKAQGSGGRRKKGKKKRTVRRKATSKRGKKKLGVYPRDIFS